MCLRNWTEHNREYYECSIYKENPQVANECSGVKAREALKKYLFYYERVSAVILQEFSRFLVYFSLGSSFSSTGSIRDDPYWTSWEEQFRTDRAIQYK